MADTITKNYVGTAILNRQDPVLGRDAVQFALEDGRLNDLISDIQRTIAGFPITPAGTFLVAANNLSDVVSANTSLNNLLPSQATFAGRVLGTDGTNTSWVAALSTGLPSANIFVGNAGNIATAVAMSGDVAISNTGATTIQNLAITTAKINTNAVTYAKMQQASATTLLGNPTGALANVSEITLGAGLSFVGTTLVSSGGGGESLAATLAIGNTTGAFDIVVNTGQQIIGQTDLLLGESTGNSYYYASAGYIFQQWYDGLGLGNTDFLLQGGGTQLFSHLAMDIQCDTGLYGFYQGTAFRGTLDFTALTGNQSYAFQNGSGTLAFLSDIVAGTTIANDPIWAALGDIVYGTGAATGAVLAGHTNADNRYLRQTGTGVVSAAPSWVRLDAGDITTGILLPANGGTGIASYAVGDLLYASGATTLSKLADVAVGSYLRSGGVTTAPLWSTLTLPNTTTINRILWSSAANVISDLATANDGFLITDGSGVPSIGTVAQSRALMQPLGSLTFNHIQQTTPVDAQVTYFGTYGDRPLSATAGSRLLEFPYAITIIGVSVSVIVTGVLGTTEASTIAIRINGSDNTLISTVKYDAATAQFSASGLNIAVAATNTAEIKLTYNTWATNPTGVTHTLTIWYYRT